MMRECLSMTAYSLGARLLPSSLSLGHKSRSTVSIVVSGVLTLEYRKLGRYS